MSWDAELQCKCCGANGDGLRDWNFTHNCNGMANTVLDEAGFERPVREGFDWKESFWAVLNGMEGPEGAAMLDIIIKGLEADPVRFDAMNPENGWGSRERLVEVLTEMRDSVPEFPTVWRCWG